MPLGFILPTILEQLIAVPEGIRGQIELDPGSRTITMFPGQTADDQRQKITDVVDYWREKGVFSILKNWRNEPWPVYTSTAEIGYNIERSACGLFGVNRYGVHLTAFVRSESSSYGLKIWVPTRAATKPTYPDMLDNTVAGGLMSGEDPLECVAREANEEASLPETLIRTSAVPSGTVSYIYITDERAGGEKGLIYPECQWVYDLELPTDIIPSPKDGEVASFDLCTVEEVWEQLGRGRFKPNCALVMLDFFIRHGIMTKESEADFEEILRRIHRQLPFPGPHQETGRKIYPDQLG